ncbi:MAG: hypothetical protein M1837_000147 [Sclerophora amabilis]|nr:MAG: hypothetical protein M1837_000147 [Sclerophora amabilis]
MSYGNYDENFSTNYSYSPATASYSISSPSIGHRAEPMSQSSSMSTTWTNSSTATSPFSNGASELAPPGFPPGYYTLQRETNGEVYWLLRDDYQVSSEYPKTILVSRSEQKEFLVCLSEGCESMATPKRKADLERHYNACHNADSPRYDCPKRKCSRKGVYGFGRRDHLNEHLRDYHNVVIPKRGQY